MLLDYLSSSLVLTNDFVLMIANTANDRYNKFSIPKKNGGVRVVYQPQKELKLLQRVLHDDFLGKIKLHPRCTAYCRGSSVLKNANIHKDNKFLLRLDLVDFFKSITSNDILLFLSENKSELKGIWSEEDFELLLKIVCYKGRLTMGGVTSPVISNLVCSKLDMKLYDLCASLGVTYSRYADDMYFSTNKKDVLFSMPNQLIKLLRTLEYPSRLILNTSKTKHSSKKRKMSITGLVITNDGKISLGRDKKREIRTLVFKWDSLTDDKKKYLQGYLSYCASVEPLFINSLCVKFSSAVISKIQSFTS
ncbi:retron St85 family RNA-directed DNA polymerase [Serratia sp. NA_13]|uniref:retron St85 family RNA-directed DNA polymerase n=1 Tax=Serratia sp. NA_13 TaxID=3415658 RepID=UPI004046EB00